MTECCDEGTLRTHLADPGSLPEADRKDIETHLADCEGCRADLENLRLLQSRVSAGMASLAPRQAPDMQLALQKMRSALDQEQSPNPINRPAPGLPPSDMEKPSSGANRRTFMQTFSFANPARRPALVSGLLAALIVLSLVVFPPVRTAADTFLQSFRANSVMFVSVDQSRIQEIIQASGDPSTLFLSAPQVVGQPKNFPAGSLDEAGTIAGFTPAQPDAFPSKPESVTSVVHEQFRAQAQVNIHNISRVMQTLGINDITLPDQLGSTPITADVPAMIETDYSGTGYNFRLVQGHTPTVNMPKGVDLAQVGEAGLRVLGMQPDQAKQLSQQIDWSTTLVVPFPTGMSDVVRVQVGEAQGLLVSSDNPANRVEGGRTNVLYWQNGDRFYVLVGNGSAMTSDMMVVLARSVK